MYFLERVILKCIRLWHLLICASFLLGPKKKHSPSQLMRQLTARAPLHHQLWGGARSPAATPSLLPSFLPSDPLRAAAASARTSSHCMVLCKAFSWIVCFHFFLFLNGKLKSYIQFHMLQCLYNYIEAIFDHDDHEKIQKRTSMCPRPRNIIFQICNISAKNKGRFILFWKFIRFTSMPRLHNMDHIQKTHPKERWRACFCLCIRISWWIMQLQRRLYTCTERLATVCVVDHPTQLILDFYLLQYKEKKT